MSKQLRVQPESLHERLCAWGRWASDNELGASKGYPTSAAFIALKVDVKGWAPKSVWEVSQQDCIELNARIQALENKYKLALIRIYKPHKARSAEVWLHAISPSKRNWSYWAHEAAALLSLSNTRITNKIATCPIDNVKVTAV